MRYQIRERLGQPADQRISLRCGERESTVRYAQCKTDPKTVDLAVTKGRTSILALMAFYALVSHAASEIKTWSAACCLPTAAAHYPIN